MKTASAQVVRRVRIVGIAAVVALAALFAVQIQARAADTKLEKEFRAKVGPLDPAAYASPAAPDADNAAIWLRSAALSLDLSKADKALVGGFRLENPKDWTEKQKASLEEVLARNAPALALAAKAATMTRSGYLLPGARAVSARSGLPLLNLMWLARTIDARTRLAVERGDWRQFREGVAELACLGASLERESPLIGQLIGLAAERMMSGSLLAGLSSPAAKPEAFEGLGSVIPDVDLVAAWKRALGCLGAGVASGTLSLHDMFDEASARVGIAVPSPEDYLRIVLGEVGLAARPMGEDADLAVRLDARGSRREEHLVGNTLAATLVRYQSVLSLRRLSRLALGARLAALETGRYPETLAAWPESAAPDPFTGGKLVYERRADGSAVLAVPGAGELYDRINEIRTFVPFAWQLPPPGRGVSSAARRDR